MFSEPADEVQRWLRGDGGVKATGLGVALPYLPPFVASLDTLHTLLASKEHLGKNAVLLLSTETPDHNYSLCSGGEEVSHPEDPGTCQPHTGPLGCDQCRQR